MPEAKRTHGQARPSYGPGVQGTGVFGNPRVPSHRSFRSRLRRTPAQKFEGRNPQGTKARGNDPRRPRGRTACCPAGIRFVGVSGSRIVLEKDGSVLEFPKQPTHASGSSPRKLPLLRKPENGKLPDRTRLRTGTNRDSQPTGKNRAVGQPSDRNEQKWQNKNRLGRQAVPSRRTDTPFRKEAGRALRHETWIVYKQAPGRG